MTENLAPPPAVPARPRAWFSFRLRTLLLATILIAGALAIWTTRARDQARRVARLQPVSWIAYDYQFRAHRIGRKLEPSWSHEPSIVDYFHSVASVALKRPPNEEELAEIARLPGLKNLDLVVGPTAEWAPRLGELRSLESIILSVDFGGRLIPDEVADELPKLRRLKSVTVVGELSDAGLRRLHEIPSLERVYFFNVEEDSAEAQRLKPPCPPCEISFYRST